MTNLEPANGEAVTLQPAGVQEAVDYIVDHCSWRLLYLWSRVYNSGTMNTSTSYSTLRGFCPAAHTVTTLMYVAIRGSAGQVL